MSILCTLGGHEAADNEVYNCGYWFSRCRRCGRDMMRTGGAWEVVPQGHRVVWHSGFAAHSIPTSFAHVLPIVHPEANLPMVRPRFASWSRMLVRARKAAQAKREAPEGEPRYPMLLVLATIVGAGLQCLFSLRRSNESYS